MKILYRFLFVGVVDFAYGWNEGALREYRDTTVVPSLLTWDLGKYRPQINCKENAFGQKCFIARLKRGLIIKVFCHASLVLFIKRMTIVSILSAFHYSFGFGGWRLGYC